MKQNNQITFIFFLLFYLLNSQVLKLDENNQEGVVLDFDYDGIRINLNNNTYIENEMNIANEIKNLKNQIIELKENNVIIENEIIILKSNTCSWNGINCFCIHTENNTSTDTVIIMSQKCINGTIYPPKIEVLENFDLLITTFDTCQYYNSTLTFCDKFERA